MAARREFTEGQAYEVIDGTRKHAYYPSFLIQIFNEYDMENINLLAYIYGVSERTMSRILKVTYLYIKNDRPDLIAKMTPDEIEKLNEMEHWDSVRYVPSQLEKQVRRYLKNADIKKAKLDLTDLKKSGKLMIEIEKR